jgi:hypothetical protein
MNSDSIDIKESNVSYFDFVNKKSIKDTDILKSVRYEDIEDRLRGILLEKFVNSAMMAEDADGFYLMKGFINPFVQGKLSNIIPSMGYTFPMVAIVGKNTGKVQLFALKSLMPDLDI